MAALMFRHFNNIMELYIIENYKEKYPDLKGSVLTDELIKECLLEFGIQCTQVFRTAKGKPYVPGVHLSVSHGGDYFVCIIADKPVGIDVQEKRRASSEKIAARYFSSDENNYIKENGEAGFFKLWTRKEAYSKLTGEGLAELIRGTEVINRNDVEFTDFQIENGVWCSYCIEV